VRKKCWRCGEEIDRTYGNGMCEDCYSECSHANEVHKSMLNDFEEGELSEENFDKEYRHRLKQ